jgi:hypothetical protein
LEDGHTVQKIGHNRVAPGKGVKKVDKMALGKSDTIMAVAEPLRTFIVNDPTVSFV